MTKNGFAAIRREYERVTYWSVAEQQVLRRNLLSIGVIYTHTARVSSRVFPFSIRSTQLCNIPRTAWILHEFRTHTGRFAERHARRELFFFKMLYWRAAATK